MEAQNANDISDNSVRVAKNANRTSERSLKESEKANEISEKALNFAQKNFYAINRPSLVISPHVLDNGSYLICEQNKDDKKKLYSKVQFCIENIGNVTAFFI